MNLGIPILTVQWLHHSLAKHEWIANTEAYLIKDDEAESKFKFQLSESLTVARSQLVQPRRGASHGTWLEDYEVIILQPNKVALLKDVIETAGGKVRFYDLQRARIKAVLTHWSAGGKQSKYGSTTQRSNGVRYPASASGAFKSTREGQMGGIREEGNRHL